MKIFQHSSVFLLVVTVLLLTAYRLPAVSVAQRGNQLFLDGKLTSLTFARGLTNPLEIPAYHAIGFNTILVTIDTPGKRALNNAETLISTAEKEGLFVLVELANGAWSANKYANLDDTDYVQNVAYYLDTVLPQLKTHPNIIGWVISTVDEDQSVAEVTNFQTYLRTKYGTLENMNSALSHDYNNDDKHVSVKTQIPAFNVITSPQAYLKFAPSDKEIRETMAGDVTDYLKLLKQRDASFQAYLHARYKSLDDLSFEWQCSGHWQFSSWGDITVDKILARENDQPESSTASLLELARYQALYPAIVMDWWVKQVRQRDPSRLIFAGNQHKYRTLVTLPHSVNGAVTECYPGYVEADLDSQNPHAIDIARRGNSFAVLAGVLAQNISPTQMVNALYEAAVHGAAGLCVTDWPTLRASLQSSQFSYAQAVRVSLTDIAQRNLLNRVPAPRVAIVYSPYAPGHNAGSRSIYGYLANFLYRGPDSVFFNFREGTSFGQFDFLAADDLMQVPLAKYQSIILPSVIDIPDGAQDALLQFTRAGGTVIADIGLGTMQANKNFYFLPAKLLQLFNINNVPGLRRVQYNLEVYQRSDRLPSLTSGLRTSGISNGFMIARMAQFIPLGGTQLLFTAIKNKKYGKPTLQPREPLKLQPVEGVSIYQQGKGYAIFAPFPLYQFWLPENTLFSTFHYDLLGYNADVSLLRPIDFLPRLACVAAYADGSVVTWTKDQTRPETEVRNPFRRFYDVDQGYCSISPESTKLEYLSAGFHIAEPLPISVDSVPFTVNFAITNRSTDAMEFDLNTDDANAGKSLVLRLASGEYVVAPNSTHQVTCVMPTGQQSVMVQADQRGQLTLSLPARCHVRISGSTTRNDGDREVPVDVTPLAK
ncbi:MAG TPA: hypothetical protein VHV83_20560 [Armatimonadota bacterium]|nr:hypothetical protein [Armatimonadota bacterium]